MDAKTESEVKKSTKKSWILDEMWRKTWPWEQEYANHLRIALVTFGGSCYVAASRDDNPQDYEGATANCRGSLQQIIQELSLDDLNAVYYVARLLLLYPDMVDVHELARERDEAFLKRMTAQKIIK